MFKKWIRQILHLLIPGRTQDPAAVIGTCLYCDAPVVYADGDRDDSGIARHDRCRKLVRENAMNAVRTSSLCLDAVRILCEISNVPDVVSRGEAAIRELPENGVTPQDVLVFVAKAIRIVDESPLTPTNRAILRSKFQGLKRQILAQLSC